MVLRQQNNCESVSGHRGSHLEYVLDEAYVIACVDGWSPRLFAKGLAARIESAQSKPFAGKSFSAPKVSRILAEVISRS